MAVLTATYRILRVGICAPALALAVLIASGATARADALDRTRPKLGPQAVTIQQSHAYLRAHDARDYWALSPYYVPQATGSACSLATVAMVVNALRGLPPLASDEIVTQAALLRVVDSADWANLTAERGGGVTFDELRTFLTRSLVAFGVDADIEVFKPADSSPATLAQLRRILAENERSDTDIAVIYYNQGVVTGDWDGPHLSPIGAYDEGERTVLIMDVDRQFYVPYWTSDETLLAALLRPSPARFGRLAGETGGIVWVKARPVIDARSDRGLSGSVHNTRPAQ